MTGAVISYALLAALATALLVASLTDLRARHIDNRLNFAIALVAPLWWLATGLSPFAMGVQIGLAAATFAVACVLFVLRQMGGGDVKLLAALALWFAPSAFAQLVMLMAILGGGASLVMAALNMTAGRAEPVRDGLAGIATLGWAWCIGAIAIAIALDRPILGPASVEAVARMVPNPWIALGAGIALLLLMAMAMRYIVRRQKSRIEVPYGIAIAAAALWVMGSQTLPSL